MDGKTMFANLKDAQANAIKFVVDKIEDFGENVFLHVFNITHHDDLSAYICDDFCYFIESIEMNYESKWLNSLFYSYAKNLIPYSKLEQIEGNLQELIDNLLINEADLT